MSRVAIRALLVALTSLLAGAGTSMGADRDAPHQGTLGPLVLERFFTGHLTAEGRFRNRLDGSERGVRVVMRGSWDGTVLTLVEDFVYSDGEKDRKTWRFTKIAPGRYSGTREDVLGTADVRQDGEDILLTYTALVGGSGPKLPVRFADRLTLLSPTRLRNTADVTFLFAPVGEVDLTIRRLGR